MIKVFYSTIILQMKQSFARPMFRFCLICNPIVNTIFLYELFLNKGTEAFLNYVVLGAGLMGIWSCICFSSVGDINRERYSGTLALIYTAPIGFGKIILAKAVGNTLLSLVSFFLSYVTAGILSGEIVKIPNTGRFFFSLFLMVVCFIVVSLLGAYALMLSRKTELYMNLLEIPLIFLCGFTFPVEVLPEGLQLVSNSLAPTWAVRLVRESMSEVSSPLYWEHMVTLLLELLVLIGVTWILYQWVDKNVRKKATLEVS